MVSRIFLLGVLAAGPLVASCDDGVSSVAPAPPPTDEARLLSVVLGKTVRPDEGLATTITAELASIRIGYGERFPELLDLEASPPWLENTVWLWMTEAAAGSVRDGTYTAWDSLNQEQGASLQRVSSQTPSVLLRFDDVIHPRLMGALYSGLPGVVHAGPDSKAGDWPNVYPLLRDAGRTYLFRAAGGDCLSGCTINEYWYFRFHGTKVEFAGHWDPKTDPEPAWWTEADENRQFLHDW